MEITITIKMDGNGLKDVEVKREETVKEEKSEVRVSPYARFFDEGCPAWQKDPEYNLSFLISQQNYCTNLLGAKGYLFLNEVYSLLGLPETKDGQVVGWVYDEKSPIGDNFVDFGIFKTEKSRTFVNGYANSILLDFNVDGCIIDKVL